MGLLLENRKWRWWLALAILVVGVFLIAKGLKQWEQARLPVYTWSQEPSSNRGFMKSSLSGNGVVYVRDYTELPLGLVDHYQFPLSLFHHYGAVFGRTDSLGRLYKIHGQDEGNYIVYDDGAEMTEPLIFRKETVKPQHILNIPVSEVMLKNNYSIFTKIADSDDPSLIDEIVNTIRENSRTPFPENYCRIYTIILCPDNLRGIGYRFFLLSDKEHVTYIQDYDMQNLESRSKLIPAGRLLTAWVASKIKI